MESLNSHAVISKFPKPRLDLPSAYQEIYAKHYTDNRQGNTPAGGLSQKMEQWMHRRVARGSSEKMNILELGGGTLNHLKYEKFKDYDVVEPFQQLIDAAGDRKEKVRKIYSDVSEIELDQKYDRVISVAVLEHLCDLPRILAKAALHLSPEGEFVHAIPAEGTLLWWLGYQLTTGLEFRMKYKLDYSVLMKHEHVNNAQEIREVLKVLFENVELSTFGPSPSLSFYHCLRAKKPRLDIIEELAVEI